MGKTRLLAVIVAFLIVAILAVLLLPGQEPQPEPKKEEEPTVSVVAARMEIPAYETITEEMVYLMEVPESSVHENDLSSMEDVIGYRSLVSIVTDEVIMSNHVISPDDPANRLSFIIPSGMRAMTVAVDDTTGLCNQIRAGDFVDVIVAVKDIVREEEEEKDDRAVRTEDETEEGGFKHKELGRQEALQAQNSGRMLSLLTLQNIQVLSLDQDTRYAPMLEGSTDLRYYRQVTLSVTPEDTLKLGWAQYEGKIYLALRAENDDGQIETEPYGAVKALVTEGEE